MAGLGTALVSVGADVSQFENDLAGALENALGKNKFVQVLATSAAAGVAAVIAEFVPLEKAILQIFQIQGVDASNEMFTALSNQLLDVASRVGKPAQEVGAAIALGVGRGFTQAEAIDISEVSANLSVALGEDLESSTKAVTAALNGFNLEADQADRVAGTLFATLGKAGVPMSQIAQQIGNIAPVARNAGVSIEDAAAAVATMVQQGVSAAESTTQIRTAMTELARSGSDGGKVFQSIAGKTFPEFIKEGHTLGQALDLIQAAADRTGYSVGDLTGNYNTQNAVVGVAVNGLENYTKNLSEAAGGIEGLENAVDSANQGALRQFQIAINEVRTSVQRIAMSLRPAFQAIMAELTPLATELGTFFNGLAVNLESVDWTAFAQGVASALRFIGSLIAPFIQLIVSVFNLLKGLDWAAIWAGVQAFATPFVAVLVAIRAGVGAVADGIAFLTPAIQSLFNFIAPLIPAVASLAGIFVTLNLGLPILVAGIGAVVGVVIKLTGAIKTLFLLAKANPWIAAITALTVAFTLAWTHFEGFRNAVVNGVNMIKDAVATGVQWIVKILAGWFDFQLMMIEKILRAAGKLPKWAGGGAFDTAADAVASMRAGINSVVESVNSLADAARAADWELNQMLKSGGVVMSRAGQLPPGALLMQKRAAQQAAPKAPSRTAPITGGLDEIMNPDKNKAKQAAADALSRVKDMLRDIFEAVQELAEDIGEKSVDSIENSFDSILKKYNEAIAAAAAAGRTSIVKDLRNSLKDIQKFEKTLLKLASKRDVVADRLKVAEDALASLRKESDQFEAATKAAFYNIGSVAEASAGIGVTFRGIRNNMRDAIRTTDMFNQAIKDLQKLGLNEDSLRQLAEAGPAALDQARALVRSGAAGIKEINQLEALLDDASGKVADRLADDFYNAGIASANGLVAGLQKQLPKIIKEMEKVADAMTNAVKKKLKIKSPSGVFDQEIGRMIPAGAAAGVRRGIPELVKAVDAMAAASTSAAANFGAGAVQINGVSDPMAAQRAGILAGEAIAYTLEKRRTAQRLAGVG